MTAVQSTYAANMPVAQQGMIADMQMSNRISRTSNGNITFGQPVIRVGNHNCVLASLETLEAVGAAGSPAPAGATITAAPTVGTGAKEGVYRVTAILGGSATASKWEVEDPDGLMVGIATGNTAFTGGGLTFTVTDSGTDPVVGEQFIITVTPSVGTADLDVLGLTIRDPSLTHDTVDRYEQYDSVSIMDWGVMWVTAGATVVAGDPVYWIVASGKYTNVAGAGNLPLRNCRFETGGADTELVIVKLGPNHIPNA